MSTAHLVSAVVGLLGALGLGLGAAEAQMLPSAVAAPVYMPVGEITTAPVGWHQFCQIAAPDCATAGQEARDVVLSPVSWHTLVAVNAEVNRAVAPVTDQDHYGRAEWWSYPDDGKGDCEDYVLQKRRLLLGAGWPRSALLITVVRDRRGDGHAVLTVKTDRGEFILDNQEDDVLPWTDTGYRFVKRQSQDNQNTWVWLGDRLPTPLVAAR